MSAGKQSDIILKFEKSDAVIDVVNGRKQNDIMRKFQKSDVMPAGKQSDIIRQVDAEMLM